MMTKREISKTERCVRWLRKNLKKGSATNRWYGGCLPLLLLESIPPVLTWIPNIPMLVVWCWGHGHWTLIMMIAVVVYYVFSILSLSVTCNHLHHLKVVFVQLIMFRIAAPQQHKVDHKTSFTRFILISQVVVHSWDYRSNVPCGVETFLAAWPCWRHPHSEMECFKWDAICKPSSSSKVQPCQLHKLSTPRNEDKIFCSQKNFFFWNSVSSVQEFSSIILFFARFCSKEIISSTGSSDMLKNWKTIFSQKLTDTFSGLHRISRLR